MPKIILLLISMLLFTATAEASLPLPAEKAFGFSAYMEKSDKLIVEWSMAPGYYLYRDKLTISSTPAEPHRFGPIGWPKAKNVYLSIRTEAMPSAILAYQGLTRIPVPLNASSHKELKLTVKYQGCSQDGFCYAPEKKVLYLTFPFSKAGLNNTPLLMVSDAPAARPHQHELPAVEKAEAKGDLLTDQALAKAFIDGHLFIVTLLCFLGLGILLAFTPCSLPMIPILSSIIIGQRGVSGSKAFYLSLCYVFGVALTYALAGMAIAWLGGSVQVYFQNPWIIAAFSGLFVLLALSMLGCFKLRLPGQWQQKISSWQQQQRGGTYGGVFLMGCFSSLIVSPCVTAPLVGVLAYVTESGNLLLGGAALFALGLGMGLPLLVIGFSAGKYLPKAGPWMELINKFFAFLLLGLAVYMMSRLFPGGFSLFLWACLLITAAVYFFFSVEELSKVWRYVGYGLSGLLVLYGLVLFIGLSMSYTSPFYPFEKWQRMVNTERSQAMDFVSVKDMTQLNAMLQQAKAENKPAVIDFYAEWCESCRAVEETVLREAKVQEVLHHFVLIRANVTENNDFDQTLLKRYNVIAPPTFIFFNRQGQEQKEHRIVGEVGHQLFLAHAKAI